MKFVSLLLIVIICIIFPPLWFVIGPVMFVALVLSPFIFVFWLIFRLTKSLGTSNVEDAPKRLELKG